MANYNTFNLIDTKSKRVIITTSSARKCKKEMQTGRRIDIWNDNTLIDVIYMKNIKDINKYVELEKAYIARKQQRATERNKKRRAGGKYGKRT